MIAMVAPRRSAGTIKLVTPPTRTRSWTAPPATVLDRTVEAARGSQVEIFQAGVLAHAGAAQPLRQGGIERGGVLAIDEKGEAFLEGQRHQIRLIELRPERIGHGVEVKRVEFLDGLLVHD